MKIFASKPTKQDIFISIIIFLFGILFYIGMSKFRGVGKDKKPKYDTIFMKCDSLTYSDSLAIFSLVDELKAREGYRDTIYWSIDYDKVKRAYTGYGHQMRKKDWKVLKFPLKREQVDSMLWADIKSAYWYHRDLDRKELKKKVKSIFISGKE
jgi:hypothetical protein